MPISNQSERIVPNCRYGHGDLKLIEAKYPGTDTLARFAFVSNKNVNMQFVGSIYTCSVCGYTEFFDDDPEFTAENKGEFK